MITLQEALKEIVRYNGYSECLKEMISDIQNDEFTCLKYWKNPEDTTISRAELQIYDELHFIAMLLCIKYGDYGTSPRGGWINKYDKPEEAITFLKALIAEEDDIL